MEHPNTHGAAIPLRSHASNARFHLLFGLHCTVGVFAHVCGIIFLLFYFLVTGKLCNFVLTFIK